MILLFKIVFMGNDSCKHLNSRNENFSTTDGILFGVSILLIRLKGIFTVEKFNFMLLNGVCLQNFLIESFSVQSICAV